MSGTVRLLEQVAFGDRNNVRVDRENCVIHGVKILGERSANPPPRDNEYPRATRERAIGLIENARVYLDHPADPRKARGYLEGLARLRAVHEAGDGLRGNLHYNPEHPASKQLLWDAENCPENLALSINADGRTKRADGRNLVEEIVAVHSVDLVSRGGTVNSLYESRTPTVSKTATGKKTRRQKLAEAVLSPPLRKWLLEDMPSSMDMDQPADEPIPGGSGDDMAPMPADDAPGHGAELMQAVCDMIDGALEGTDESALAPKYLTALNKIKAIADGFKGGDEGEEEPTEEEPTDGKTQEGKKPGKRPAGTTALSEELRVLKREKDMRRLCEQHKVAASDVFVSALARLSDDEAKALIEERKAGTGAGTGSGRPGPRSQAPGATRLTEGKLPADAKGFASALLG